MTGMDAPASERIDAPMRTQTLFLVPVKCGPPSKSLPLYTQTHVEAIEANAHAVCREQWKGAVLLGVLIGAGGGQLLEVAIEFFAF